MSMIAADKKYLVVGLGLTGVSCVRYLQRQGKFVEVIDSRDEPPGLDAFVREFPAIKVHLGLSADVLSTADILVMSPGVPLAEPAIQKAIKSGAVICSDIELFMQAFSGKVVAITGSNAKSTVTAWLGEALRLAGRKVLVAGNIGLPVLQTLDETYDVAVLELSSFQLELLPRLKADVACVLNISEDHLDRYASMAHYIQAKQRIYFGTGFAVYNREEALTQPLLPDSTPKVTFGLNEPDLKDFGLRTQSDGVWLCHGFNPIVAAGDVSLPGRHNLLNALAVLALADAVGNPQQATVEAIKTFKGLPYRCEWIADKKGVRYINDSKATNVGSTVAALTGLVAEQGANIHLLAGGQAKGQDLSPLADILAKTCKNVFAFGEDRLDIGKQFGHPTYCENLEDALKQASDTAEPGDIVLLSPACASFDQFRNFEHRGDVFNKLVEVTS